MPLALYGHPFSSYTWKALIALYENGTPFTFKQIGPAAPGQPEVSDAADNASEWARRWSLQKFPMLVDGDRQYVETSIIIEYLQLAYPGPVRLLPEDPMAALDVRFLDRVFDLHVMDAMQSAVATALGRAPGTPEEGLARACERLNLVYAWLEEYLSGRSWAVGEAFSLADCAAAPSLFYADWVHRISDAHPNLRAYRARLLARPSVARAVDGARPYRSYFPLGAPERD